MAVAGPLLVVNAYPDLTLPQADDGNVLVLAYRARARGIAVETHTVHCGDPLPPADIYVAGGLEDDDQPELARWLDSGVTLRAAVDGGAAVLAVNSAFQILGERYALSDGTPCDGLGLIDARTTRGGSFLEGPVVTCPNPAYGLPVMSGYESHHGLTALGADAGPLAALEVGHGNTGGAPAVDGVLCGRVVGTYLHGPVLARNPELADFLLAAATGERLQPMPASFGEASRARRIDDARRWARAWRKHVKM